MGSWRERLKEAGVILDYKPDLAEMELESDPNRLDRLWCPEAVGTAKKDLPPRNPAPERAPPRAIKPAQVP